MKVALAVLAVLSIMAVALVIRLDHGPRGCWHCADPYGWVIQRRG